METIVAVRHCEIPEDLKERARQHVAKLAKLARRPVGAEVVFDADHGTRIVELRLRLARGNPKIASAEAMDFLTALDGAVAKLRKQLDRDPKRPNRRPLNQGDGRTGGETE